MRLAAELPVRLDDRLTDVAKHSAAIGEALAQQLTDGHAAHVDLEPFRVSRLAEYLTAH